MIFYNLNLYLIFIDLMLMVLISVAFFTLLERKVLGYIQLRKGPNKVGYMGLFQPFSDAIKLFSKENMIILKSNYFFYLVSPLLNMFLMILLWYNLPILFNLINSLFNLLMILCLMSMGVYGLMIAGWSSNSIYSLIGGLRSIAQTISYEVSMILILLCIFFLIESFNLFELLNFQYFIWFSSFLMMNMFIMYVSFLAELNRTPFDFSEGESELVSGFNTEYMSGSFAIIFIAEYGMIMLLMMMFNFLYFGGNIFSLYFYLIYMILLFSVIWIRGTYPRFRYDNLMYLTWKSYLLISLFMIIFILGFKLLI